MNEMNDQHFAAQIQESREKAKRSTYLNVRASDNHIRISYGIPTEPNSSRKTTINVRRGEMQYEQVMAAIGEILGQNHDQLQHFSLLDLDCENNGYPQFWSGLAANRVLKEVGFDECRNEPVGGTVRLCNNLNFNSEYRWRQGNRRMFPPIPLFPGYLC